MDRAARRVVITGANRGLGLELARQCLQRGDIVWAGCRSPESAEELRALGAAKLLQLDVSDPASIAEFGQAVASQTETLDLLINNAGANGKAFGADVGRSGVLHLAPEHFMAEMRVNALGPMLMVRALMPLLRKVDSAVIANISSQLGSIALGAQMLRDIGYNASKAALNMITTALAGTLAAESIVTVSIHPGWVQTDMGGRVADLTAEASARSVLSIVDGLDPSDNGTFLLWDGSPHPW